MTPFAWNNPLVEEVEKGLTARDAPKPTFPIGPREKLTTDRNGLPIRGWRRAEERSRTRARRLEEGHDQHTRSQPRDGCPLCQEGMFES